MGDLAGTHAPAVGRYGPGFDAGVECGVLPNGTAAATARGGLSPFSGSGKRRLRVTGTAVAKRKRGRRMRTGRGLTEGPDTVAIRDRRPGARAPSRTSGSV